MTTAAQYVDQSQAVPQDRMQQLLERNLLPDWLIRFGIRRLLAQRLREEDKGSPEAQQEHLMQLITRLRQGPLAIETAAANAQHYEVPARFFELVLGPHLKYSSALWPAGVHTLEQAEQSMLALTCQRAELADGQQILELGCGWGSLSLYMAQQFPSSRIVSVSNSRSQKQFIDARAAARGLRNLEVVTCDMNQFVPTGRFDRVVSVEMFEHMRNHELLLMRIADWLQDQGKLFVHIFTHRRFTYLFDIFDQSDWMARYFFTGGIMPGENLLLYFQRHLRIEKQWQVSGTHYQRTAESWLRNTDRHTGEILQLFARTYGSGLAEGPARVEALRWLVRWRVFFMACAELWGFRSGSEWGVTHYLFGKQSTGLAAGEKLYS